MTTATITVIAVARVAMTAFVMFLDGTSFIVLIFGTLFAFVFPARRVLL
jgi:hypothetical protein